MVQQDGKVTTLESLTWRDFVCAFARAFERETSPADFESAYVGRKVRWQGEVYEVFGKEAYVPMIQVAMPREAVPLGDGRTFVGEFFVLEIAVARRLACGKEIEAW